MNAKTGALQSVLVVGAGYAPYLAALTLKRCLTRSAQVRVLEIAAHGASPRVLSSTSHWRALHGDLGIREEAFLLHAKAQPSLGWRIRVEGTQPSDFMLCESEYGFLLRGKTFNKLFAEFAKHNPGVQLDDFCLQAGIARQNRFSPGSDDPKSLFNMVSYGYTVETLSYAAFLKQVASSSGIETVTDEVASVVAGEEGIEAVHTVTGARLQAHLFIDCSSERLLANTVSRAEALDGSLPQVSVTTNVSQAAAPKPYMDIALASEGLKKTYNLITSTIEETWTFPGTIKPWCSAPFWAGNCLALAGAARAMPLAVLDELFLLQVDLRRLLDFWPSADTLVSCRRAYNKIADEWTQQVIDVENCFFSIALQATDLTDNNQHRLNLFRETGRLPSYERDVLNSGQWVALLHALGVREGGFEEDLSSEAGWINKELSKIRATFAAAASSSPEYSKLVNQIGNP